MRLKLSLVRALKRLRDRVRRSRVKQIPSQQRPLDHFFGTLFFLSLVLCFAQTPWLLPLVYVVLCAIGLPLRVIKYTRLKWQFFLLDFCYLTNLLVLAHLLFFPENSKLQARQLHHSLLPLCWPHRSRATAGRRPWRSPVPRGPWPAR